MTTSTKGKSFTYNGGLDGIELCLPTHTYTFVRGEAVEVCAEDAAVLATRSDFTSGTKKAPADSTPKEV
jgi:hypothetical protein